MLSLSASERQHIVSSLCVHDQSQKWIAKAIMFVSAVDILLGVISLALGVGLLPDTTVIPVVSGVASGIIYISTGVLGWKTLFEKSKTQLWWGSVLTLSSVSILVSISFASMSLYGTMMGEASDLEWAVQMSLIGVNVFAVLNNISLFLMAFKLVCCLTSSNSNDPISTNTEGTTTSLYLPSPYQIKSTANVGVSTQSFIQTKKY